jgi:hypothetical protein
MSESGSEEEAAGLSTPKLEGVSRPPVFGPAAIGLPLDVAGGCRDDLYMYAKGSCEVGGGCRFDGWRREPEFESE